MGDLKIGEVAKSAGVTVDTVRFYERKGLIPEPPRSPSGYRTYPAPAVDRIRFVRRAKALGFTLEETRELLDLHLDGEARPRDVRARASAKVHEVDGKILDLRAIRSRLGKLVEACSGEGDPGGCAILAALSDEESLEGRPS